ncbi:MAG TPA: FHA domain-containing protein [Candidatus Ozemobacteraceae bacterium]|nr:FHA domain-containing protein [Candidatus Ozemobacteraceae bacterium]
MSGATELVLTAFEPALEELARRVDAGADPAGTVNAALALFQGIAATAMLPGGVPGTPGEQAAGRWDGVFEDGRLSLLRPGYQFSATLGVGLLQTAVMNGPACITWMILRSGKGLHVTVKSPTGGTLHDLLIGLAGDVRDERDTTGKLRRAKEEFDEIARRPIESLPNGTPGGGAGPAAGSSVPDLGGMLGQAAKGAAAAAAGAVLAAAAGSVARAAASAVEPGKTGGPPAPPPPAPKPAPSPVQAKPPATPAAPSAPSAPGRGPVLTLRLEDGRPVEIPSFPAVIGRSDETEIRLDSNRVSRRHAQIESDADGFWLTDLGSANGSFRNDVRLDSRTRLENGDRLRFADIVLRVDISGGASPAAAMATVAFRVPEELHPLPPQKSPAPPRPAAPPPPRAAATPPAPPRAPATAPPPQATPEPPAPQAAKQKIPCPACGHRCPPESTFCRACGAPLAASETPLAVSGADAPAPLPEETPHRQAPSLSFPGFLFGVFFTARLATLAFSLSPEILLEERMLKKILLGYGFAGTAFVTGAKGGLLRFVALLLGLAYGWSGVPELGTLVMHVASNPEMIDVVAPRLIAEVLSLLSAFWVLKRSFGFPK